MNSARRTLYLAQTLRKFSQSTVRNSGVTEVPSSKFEQLKVKQKKFGVDDGLPIHIKGGFSDKILYQTTLVLTAIGLAMSGEVFWKLVLK